MIIVLIVVGSSIVNGIMVERRRNRVRLRMQVIALNVCTISGAGRVMVVSRVAGCETHLVEVSQVECLLAY